MNPWKKTVVMGIAVGITACSSTRLPVGRDAAVEVNPPSDAIVVRDTFVPTPDTTTTLPDTGMPIPDLGPTIQADTATPVADTAVLEPEAVPVPAPIDTARPTLDTKEAAVDPWMNRTFAIRPEYPAPTPDPTCTQYGPTDTFQFTFGADTSTMKVLIVSGSAARSHNATFGPEANKMTYHFTDYPTGGIITLEKDQGVWVAQVILYGSGVPVVRCLRGALTPQP